MRSGLLRGGLALAVLVLQTTVGAGADVRPDFVLLFVLAAGMRRGEAAGTFWGVALGSLQDTFSAGLPGVQILTKGLLGFTAGALREQMDCGNPNTQALAAALASLAEGAAHIALLQVFSTGDIPLAPLIAPLPPAAALNGALLPAALALGGFISRRLARRSSARGRALG